MAKQIPNFISNKKLFATQLNATWKAISGDKLLGINQSTRLPKSLFDIGDLTEISGGSMVNDMIVRETGKVKSYNSSAILQDELTWAALLAAATAGGGSLLEMMEVRTQIEKTSFGTNIYTSEKTSVSENFKTPSSMTLRLMKDYNTTDTTVIKLAIDSLLIDNMDATTGWTTFSAASISQDTTNKLEGTGSVKAAMTSLNGTDGMYKIVSVNFSRNRMLVPIYLDTINNIQKATVRLWVDASNYADYDLTGLSVGWNFFWVDVPNPDTLTGTFNGFTERMYFLVTTTSAQTVNMSVDHFYQVSENDLTLPLTIPIYDATNQQLMKIASGSEGEYVLDAALVNNYTIADSVLEMYNGKVNSKYEGEHKTSSGDHAKDQYFLKRKFMVESVTNKTFNASYQWYDETFPVTSFPSLTSIKILSPIFDKSGSFKDNDYIILYNKTWVDNNKQSKYNSILASNFIKLQLNADATYSDPDITLNHDGDNEQPTGDWRVVRLSALLIYYVGADTGVESLSELPINHFDAKSDDITSKYITNFNRSNSYITGQTQTTPIADGWTVEIIAGENFNVGIESNSMWIDDTSGLSSSRHAGVWRDEESFDSVMFGKEGILVEGLFKNNGMIGNNGHVSEFYFGRDNSAFPTMYGSKGSSGEKDNGLWWYNTGGTPTTSHRIDMGDETGSLAYKDDFGAFTADTWYKWKWEVTKTTMKLKIWLASAAEPASWTIEKDNGITEFTFSGDRLCMHINNNSASGRTWSRYDDIQISSIETGEVLYCRGSISNQTGSKIVLGEKITRQDTLNEQVRIYQSDAYLAD